MRTSREEQVMMEDNLEQLHEDKSSCDVSLGEELDCGLINEGPLKTQNVQVVEIIDPLLSGTATSDVIKHNEGDTLEWHDMITDWFEDSSMITHPSHNKEACDHEQANDMISSFHDSPTPIGRHEDIKHKRTDFVYFGIDEVKRSEMLNEEWLKKAKEAKWVAANARKHLQEVKANVNLINMARHFTS